MPSTDSMGVPTTSVHEGLTHLTVPSRLRSTMTLRVWAAASRSSSRSLRISWLMERSMTAESWVRSVARAGEASGADVGPMAAVKGVFGDNPLSDYVCMLRTIVSFRFAFAAVRCSRSGLGCRAGLGPSERRIHDRRLRGIRTAGACKLSGL